MLIVSPEPKSKCPEHAVYSVLMPDDLVLSIHFLNIYSMTNMYTLFNCSYVLYIYPKF